LLPPSFDNILVSLPTQHCAFPGMVSLYTELCSISTKMKGEDGHLDRQRLAVMSNPTEQEVDVKQNSACRNEQSALATTWKSTSARWYEQEEKVLDQKSFSKKKLSRDQSQQRAHSEFQ
jgi:hypothetical protein